jgi:regulator of protease activity HflC (stomatin/prohibitin superfamily)
LAEASAESIRRIANSIGQQDAPMRYLLGEKYLAAMGKLAESANAKTIVLPADLQESLRGILGRARE